MKPEYQKLYRQTVVRAENFFKHAERDADIALDWDPRETHVLLVDSGDAYLALTGHYLRELWVFLLWFQLEYPHLLKQGALTDAVIAFLSDGKVTHSNRKIFAAAFARSGPWPSNVD